MSQCNRVEIESQDKCKFSQTNTQTQNKQNLGRIPKYLGKNIPDKKIIQMENKKLMFELRWQSFYHHEIL